MAHPGFLRVCDNPKGEGDKSFRKVHENEENLDEGDRPPKFVYVDPPLIITQSMKHCVLHFNSIQTILHNSLFVAR